MANYYLPARCSWCGHALLTPAGTTAVKCLKCDGEVQVVPGEVYREEDSFLFERIAAAVESSAPPGKDVRDITAELSDFAARVATPETLLARVLETMPSLRFLEPAQSHEDQTWLVHALGMLLAMLAARVEHPVLLAQSPANTLPGPTSTRLAR
jgi:hypothetical protein